MKRFVLLLTVWAMGLAGVLTAVVLPATSANAVGPTVVRLHGADRYDTSAAIVQAKYQPGVPVVYIATGVNFPDALAGGAAAAKAGGPLLVVLPNSIPTKIAAELTRLTPASIIVLGGTGAVSDGVLTSLKAFTSGAVTRVGGSDRYATAGKLAGAFPAGSPVFIATGRDFPDALAGTAAAAAKHAAILLTGPSALPAATSAALSKLAPSSITILGGTDVVSSAVATKLGTYSSSVSRLSGGDRYATAAAIATSVFPRATGVFIAAGAGFADALTGGPVAGSAGMPLLLSTRDCLPAPTAAVIAADAPATVTLLGGLDVLGTGIESLTSCETSSAALAPVTNVTATPASTSVLLSWTNPTAASLTGVMIRRAAGATAPASATSGTLVTDATKPATSFTDTGLTPGTQYSYALFAHDGTPVFAAAATVTVTTTTNVVVLPSISGMVTDAGGAHNGLAGVTVTVSSYSLSNLVASDFVTATDTEGNYTVTGLTASNEYTVCFRGPKATGGSSDLFGYVEQCWQNQPSTGTPTPLVVTSAMSGINAALVGGGAVSGKVTDAGGSFHGLANVQVSVSLATGVQRYVTTAADGSYTVTGLPASTDYQVCFFSGSGGVTGGSSDATGYVDQCFDNQPMSNQGTPVTVSLGAARAGIDAALVEGGAVSGTVTDAGGTNHGLENVHVTVWSPSTFDQRDVTTAADGSYTATRLPAGTDYKVCFSTSGGVTGGSSDATGYVNQCFDNQPTSATATLVTVMQNATRPGVNAALVGAP